MAFTSCGWGYLGVISQVAGLQAVGEGEPGKVAKSQHEAEAFMSNVHGSQNGRFHPEAVHDVDAVKNGHKPECWRRIAQSLQGYKHSQAVVTVQRTTDSFFCLQAVR